MTLTFQQRLAANRAATPARPPSTISSWDPDLPEPAYPRNDRLRLAIPTAMPDLVVHETAAGPAFVRRTTFFPATHAERTWLTALIKGQLAQLAPLSTQPAIPWDQVVFLDLETSGMAGGAGTGIVILGAGRLRDGGLDLMQCLIPAPGLEAPALLFLQDWACGASAVATYNGATFDMPIMASRSILARQPLPLLGWHHLDLLHPARRLWRWDLPDFRLQTIERDLLGITRPDDLPGAEVPALYWSVLGNGRWAWLHPVLRHNADDLIGLALAAGRMLAATTGDPVTRGEALTLALAAAHSRDPANAAARFAALLPAPSDQLDRAAEEALFQQARTAARLGDCEAALIPLQRLVAEGAIRQRSARLLIAKLAEWRQRDIPTALSHTDALLAHARLSERTALLHRRTRLLAKSPASTRTDTPAPTQPRTLRTHYQSRA